MVLVYRSTFWVHFTMLAPTNRTISSTHSPHSTHTPHIAQLLIATIRAHDLWCPWHCPLRMMVMLVFQRICSVWSHSPTLGCISMCPQIQTPTRLPSFWRQCVAIMQTHNKLQIQMEHYWTRVHLLCGWVIAIPYPNFGVIMNIVSKEDTSNHVTIGNIRTTHAHTLKKMSCRALAKRGYWCIANIYTMYLSFCARWTMIVTSSFTVQHSPSTKSWNYLNLQVL